MRRNWLTFTDVLVIVACTTFLAIAIGGRFIP